MNANSAGEARSLNRMLSIGEMIDVFDNRVVITPVGILGWLRHGVHPRTIYYSSLIEVNLVPANLLLSGFLFFNQNANGRCPSCFSVGKNMNAFVFSGQGKNQWAFDTQLYISSRIQHFREVVSIRRLSANNGSSTGAVPLSSTAKPISKASPVQSVARKNKAEKPVPTEQKKKKSQWLAKVEFSYIDRDGNFSERSVDVSAVDSRRFEGWCHSARAFRTFLIERVQGQVIDLDTGEISAPSTYMREVFQRTGGGEFLHSEPQYEPRPAKVKKEAICFTGFRAQRRQELEEMAERAGLYVATDVTMDLRYLVTGSNAGPTKIRSANEVGAEILDEEEFLAVIA